MAYYKEILKIDLQNYNKSTNKYVLFNNKNEFVDEPLSMNQEFKISNYKVIFKKDKFSNSYEAAQNAKMC